MGDGNSGVEATADLLPDVRANVASRRAATHRILYMGVPPAEGLGEGENLITVTAVSQTSRLGTHVPKTLEKRGAQTADSRSIENAGCALPKTDDFGPRGAHGYNLADGRSSQRYHEGTTICGRRVHHSLGKDNKGIRGALAHVAISGSCEGYTSLWWYKQRDRELYGKR